MRGAKPNPMWVTSRIAKDGHLSVQTGSTQHVHQLEELGYERFEHAELHVWSNGEDMLCEHIGVETRLERMYVVLTKMPSLRDAEIAVRAMKERVAQQRFSMVERRQLASLLLVLLHRS